MTSPRYRAARGSLFFALGAGAACFFLSLIALLYLGLVMGLEHFEISFTPVPQKHLSWWEIVSLLASLGLSVFTAEFVLRYCKKCIRHGNPPL
jgi:hypothetical protein